jgi:hypothetical protein
MTWSEFEENLGRDSENEKPIITIEWKFYLAKKLLESIIINSNARLLPLPVRDGFDSVTT